MFRNYKRTLTPPYTRKDVLPLLITLFLVLLIPITTYTLSRQTVLRGHAQTPSVMEFENGVPSGNVIPGTDPTASNGQYAQLGSTTGSTSFQPTAPYYATFFYLWYKAPTPDGSWSYWQDLNNPPTTWFSHYIPDQDSNPASFNPSAQLYSSNDYNNFKWQATKLAEAKQEVAIGSWWGQGRKEDTAFNNILNDFMARSDNPYPNLRWAMYYEKEAISSTTNTTPNDPSVSELVSDLNYIKTKYTTSPYFLKVNGKPVMFIYADATDVPGTMLERWNDANTQVGNTFYLVMKVFPNFATASPQPNSWHQYAPAISGDTHSPYSAFVSPGFWLDDGSAIRLGRNLSEFQTAVTSMVAANATWKLTETWNEWGEGTSVEPGFQTIINGSGQEVIDPNGAPFGNLYINTLNQSLPALEQGVGSTSNTPTPIPVSPTPTGTACQTTLPATGASLTMSTTIAAAGDYRIWTSMQPQDTTNNSYYLQIDSQCPVIVGDNTAIPANAWTWVDYQNGSSASKITATLASGSHILKVVEKEAGIRLDKLIMTDDLSCIPTGTGDNCSIATATPTLTLTPTLAVATPTQSVSLTPTSTACTGVPAAPAITFPVNGGAIAAGIKNITWNSVTGATAYKIRIDNQTDNTWNGLCTTPNAGDACSDTLPTSPTSYSLNFLPGKTYNIWMHAKNACGDSLSSTSVRVTVSGTVTTPTPTRTPTPTPTPTRTPTPIPTTIILNPTADTYVLQTSATTNFGIKSPLITDGSPLTISYLKFNLSSLLGSSINSAKLRLYITNPSNGTDSIKQSTTTWIETSMTYNTRAPLSTVITTFNNNVQNTWKEVDLTTYIKARLGQTVSFGIESPSADGVNFSSREAVNKPQLVIQ